MLNVIEAEDCACNGNFLSRKKTVPVVERSGVGFQEYLRISVIDIDPERFLWASSGRSASNCCKVNPSSALVYSSDGAPVLAAYNSCCDKPGAVLAKDAWPIAFV